MLNQKQIDQVIAIARDAGSAIMTVYAADDFGIRTKEDDSPLTRADMAAHRVIVSGLQELALEFPVLSEESTDIAWDERREWTTYWLVDPLDGTKEFIKRNGEFTVNIALIHDGVPVFGVVYAPDLDKLYWGMQGHSAYCNDMPIRAAAAGNRDTLKVVGSRSHQRSDKLSDYLESLGKPYELIPMGSSLKICLVAAGEADLYPRLGPTSEWDTAAAHGVCLAASVDITDFDGNPLRYNQSESLLNPNFLVKAK